MTNKRVALVTGSATGIGVQTALTLAARGHDVVVNYREDANKAHDVVRRVQAFGVRSIAVQADVSKESDCERMVKEVVTQLGPIDILVNNAGPYIFDHKPLVNHSTEDWRRMLDGNLSSVFYLCRLTLPMMRKRRFGRIVTFGFASASGAAGWYGRSAYAAAKVGLVSLTRTLAQEEAQYGITANMVCPGDVRGEHKDMTIDAATSQEQIFNVANGANAAQAHDVAAVHNGGYTGDGEGSSRRPGVGEDVARVVAFLCDELSDYVSGSVIEAGGGLTLDQIQT